MSENPDPTEGRILLLGIDQPAKLNGFTPEMNRQLVAAYTRLDEDDGLWCGVLFAHDDHFTAGLGHRGLHLHTQHRVDAGR